MEIIFIIGALALSLGVLQFVQMGLELYFARIKEIDARDFDERNRRD